MADEKDLAQKIMDMIAEELGLERNEVKPEATFVEDLGADSLDVVELIMKMEEEFGISIPDEDAEKIKTVQDAIDYVKSKVS